MLAAVLGKHSYNALLVAEECRVRFVPVRGVGRVIKRATIQGDAMRMGGLGPANFGQHDRKADTLAALFGTEIKTCYFARCGVGLTLRTLSTRLLAPGASDQAENAMDAGPVDALGTAVGPNAIEGPSSGGTLRSRAALSKC